MASSQRLLDQKSQELGVSSSPLSSSPFRGEDEDIELEWGERSHTDESMRDLKFALSRETRIIKADKQNPLVVDVDKELWSSFKKERDKNITTLRRQNSLPSVLHETPKTSLPDPELGRAGEIAQPGEFRRYYLRNNLGTRSKPAKSLLESMLLRLNPLLQRKRGGDIEDQSNMSVAFVIAKNFFGSAFMITPKGFEESGVIAGPLCLIFVYCLEARCMMNLISCYKARHRQNETNIHSGYEREAGRTNQRKISYQQLGECVGSWFVQVIGGMIVLCQFGFCCIWLVANAENAGMILPHFSYTWRLWIQYPLLLPLVWVRNLKWLFVTNVIGICFTIAMVIFFFYFMAHHLVQNGPRQEVVMINTANTRMLLWLGACAYVYEGINMVIPTYESAKDKKSMPKLLIGITAASTVMYISFGILTYYALGSSTKPLVSLNLDQDTFVGQAIPFASIIIGLASFPLQAFVIFHTYEAASSCDEQRGEQREEQKEKWYQCDVQCDEHKRKRYQDVGRSGVLFFTIMVTWLGGNQLQNFLALVGGFCCGSLALIFPSILHIMICEPRGRDLALDCFIFASGMGILVLSTAQAWIEWK